MEKDLGDYVCDGQMSLEDYLWESGYYMALPQGESSEFKDTDDKVINRDKQGPK